MRVDMLASARHYLWHLSDVWAALPDDAKGRVFCSAAVAPEARRLLDCPVVVGKPPRSKDPVLVAAWADLNAVRPRRTILVEHGAGQRYTDTVQHGNTHPCYPGGARRDSVILFICPSTTVGDANAAAYPQAKVAVVGSPWVDRLRRIRADRTAVNASPVVAVSWHWDGHNVCPEARTALPHYRNALGDWAARYFLLGHGHPRTWQKAREMWDSLGVLSTPNFATVVAHADVYAVDNSSTGFEAAACGIPVIWLSAPWYRVDVSHGLRFYENVGVGLEVHHPGRFGAAVERALELRPDDITTRDAHVAAVYDGGIDGHAAQRAADAIAEVIG